MNYNLASKSWDHAEYQAILRVLAGDMYKMGKNVDMFESVFAEWTGSRYAVFCNSGSSANLLAAAAIRYDPRRQFKPGSNVIVPSVSWSTTYYPLQQMGFSLKFVDVSSETYNIDVSLIENAIDANTVGVFAVNLLGSPCDYSSITKVCAANKLWMLEDNCESMGATHHGAKTGTFGQISTHSSFFSHHISTMEGGICTTNDPLLYEIMRSLRAHGWTRDVVDKKLFYQYFDEPDDEFYGSFHFVLPGFNFRPTELQGAIGIEQMKKIDNFIINRQKNADYLLDKLDNMDICSVQAVEPDSSSSWFGFGLVFQNRQLRDRALSVFRQKMIECRPIVSGNMAKQPVFRDSESSYELPVADKIHEMGIMVGNHQFSIKPQIDHLVAALNEI